MFGFDTIIKYFSAQKTNYILHKDNAYSKISNSIQLNKETNQQFNKKFDEYINRFINFINTNPNIDLKLFYENLKSLIIKEKRTFNKFLFITSYTKGHYDGYDNKILVLKEDNFYSIYHELLHCASRRIINQQMNVGFHKFAVDEKTGKITFNLGKALNEGYTTLLEKRYFGFIEHTQKRGYVIEEFISSKLEEIVGKDEMEKLYFNADLDGLINYLKQFSNEEDVYLFLEYFDKILVTAKKKVKSEEAEYIYKFIGAFLLKVYVYKLGILIENNTINSEEFLNSMDDFIKVLSINYVFDKKNNYYFLTNDFTNQILDEIYEELDNEQKNKIM